MEQGGVQAALMKIMGYIGSVDNLIVLLTLMIAGMMGAFLLRGFSRRIRLNILASLLFGALGGFGLFYILQDVMQLFEKIYLFDLDNNPVIINIWPAIACGLAGGFLLAFIMGLMKSVLRG